MYLVIHQNGQPFKAFSRPEEVKRKRKIQQADKDKARARVGDIGISQGSFDLYLMTQSSDKELDHVVLTKG